MDILGREDASIAFERCWPRAAELGILSCRCSRNASDVIMKMWNTREVWLDRLSKSMGLCKCEVGLAMSVFLNASLP